MTSASSSKAKPEQQTRKRKTDENHKPGKRGKITTWLSSDSSKSKSTGLSNKTESKSDPASRPLKRGSLTIKEQTGDLFEAPTQAVLIHACNCMGSWGAGVAAAFKKKYPNAFKLYKDHCNKHEPTSLLGTALLIAPCEKTGAPEHWIGCLFTSEKFGKGKGSKQDILNATESSMMDLMKQIVGNDDVQTIWMCRINAGLFAVEWIRTRNVLEGLDVDLNGRTELEVIHVVRPKAEPE